MKARIKKISVLCVVALTVGILSGCSGNCYKHYSREYFCKGCF